MADVVYRVDRAGLEEVARSGELTRLMRSNAEAAAAVARPESMQPETITTSTEIDSFPYRDGVRSRVVGIVTNSYSDGRLGPLAQEFGVRGGRLLGTTFGRPPLGTVLDLMRQADPGRRSS
jgi:hypothetical protein